MKKEFKGNNGKGHDRRPEDFGAIQRNWDLINWNSNTKKKYERTTKSNSKTNRH
jgi:hypothetical protein